VSVPSIGASFRRDKNFYSRSEGAVDYTNAARRVRDEAARISRTLAELERRVSDPMFAAARDRLDRAMAIALDEANPETTKQAMDDVDTAKELIARARRANLKAIRRAELDVIVQFFDNSVRQVANPAEERAFDMLAGSTARAIDDPRPEFESFANQLRSKNWTILFRQDWYVIHWFKSRAAARHLFADANAHARAVGEGEKALAAGDIDRLRHVIYEMERNRLSSIEAEDMLTVSNIARG
jgi:molecular chaperone DnaK